MYKIEQNYDFILEEEIKEYMELNQGNDKNNKKNNKTKNVKM